MSGSFAQSDLGQLPYKTNGYARASENRQTLYRNYFRQSRRLDLTPGSLVRIVSITMTDTTPLPFPKYRERVRLAETLLCDERSIRKALRGIAVRGVTGVRIRLDLRALGYECPEPVVPAGGP